jgi:DNA-binding response OmpR family regulator
MAKETILILDTDKNIAWTLKTLLESEKYPVVIAGTIERALKDFSEFRISGFITEYRIEDVPTMEAIRELKRMFPETYVMMLTDKETKEGEYEDIMQSGVDDYFLKPTPARKILLHLQKGLRYRSLLIEKNRLERERERAPLPLREEEKTGDRLVQSPDLSP